MKLVVSKIEINCPECPEVLIPFGHVKCPNCGKLLDGGQSVIYYRCPRGYDVNPYQISPCGAGINCYSCSVFKEER